MRRNTQQGHRRDGIYGEIEVMRPVAQLSIESMCLLGQVSWAVLSALARAAAQWGETELRSQIQRIVIEHRRNHRYRRVT